KREVTIISHSSLTNHRILARPGEPYPDEAYQQTTPDLPDLTLVNGPAGSRTRLAPITLLRAYGELMEKEPVYYERYTSLLDQLSKTAPNDPLVLAALGRKTLREAPKEPSDKAIEYLSKALDLGSTAATTYEDLAEALARADRLEESVGILKRGIELAPYAPVLHKALALRYI